MFSATPEPAVALPIESDSKKPRRKTDGVATLTAMGRELMSRKAMGLKARGLEARGLEARGLRQWA
jgi:hypothetical protein